MSVTVNSVTQTVAAESNQPHRQAVVNIDLDASYPTGGYPVSLVGVTNGDGYVIAMADAPPSGVYRFWWNPTTAKLMVFTNAADSCAETTLATNLSAITGLALNCILK